MAEIRVDVKDLPRDIDALLARMDAGDAVLVERDGAAVAALTPCATNCDPAAEDAPVQYPPGTWARFMQERLKQPAWSDDDYDAFLKDIETAREWSTGEVGSSWDD